MMTCLRLTVHLTLLWSLYGGLSNLSHACDLPNITNCGGILPYYYDNQNNKTYFLLGREWRRCLIQGSDRVVPFGYSCWQDFGGDLELLKSETNIFTMFDECLREAYEELHITFPPLIRQDQKLPPYVQSKHYTVFLVRLSTKISIDLLSCYFLSSHQETDSFIFHTFCNDNIEKQVAFNEKDEYQWFTLQNIEEMIKNTRTELLEPMNKSLNVKQSSTEIKRILNEISENIKKRPMLFSSFIQFFEDKTFNNQHNMFPKHSIKGLINNKVLQNQPTYPVKKWFTVLYCLLYHRINANQSSSFYRTKAVFDTTQEFLDLFVSIEKKVGSVCYNKDDMRAFLKSIHFQINTDAKTAYCALEITEFLPSLAYVDNSEYEKDHQKYLDSFLEFNKYKVLTNIINVQKNLSPFSVVNCPEPKTENPLPQLPSNKTDFSYFLCLKKVIHFFQNSYRSSFCTAAFVGLLFLFYWHKVS